MAQARLSVNINEQTQSALKGYANRHGVSITETVRRFAGVAEFVIHALEDGHQLRLRKGSIITKVEFPTVA